MQKKSLIIYFFILFTIYPIKSFSLTSPLEPLAERIAASVDAYFQSPSGRVTSVNGDKLYIDVGSKARVKSGMNVDIHRHGNILYHPQTGERIGEEWIRVAKGQIVHVESKLSVAILTLTDTTPRIWDEVSFPPLKPRLLLSLRMDQATDPVIRTLASMILWKLYDKNFDIETITPHVSRNDPEFIKGLAGIDPPAFVLAFSYVRFDDRYRFNLHIMPVQFPSSLLGIIDEAAVIPDTYINNGLIEPVGFKQPPKEPILGGAFSIKTERMPVFLPSRLRHKEDIQVCRLIYSTLVRADENKNIKSALAVEWAVSPDSTLWSFKLLPAKYPDGTVLSRTDVIEIWNILNDRASGSLWFDLLNNIQSYPDTGIYNESAPEPLLLNVKLTHPDPDFTLKISQTPASIYKISSAGAYIGHGDFTVESLSSNQLFLKRNPEASDVVYPNIINWYSKDNSIDIQQIDLDYSDTKSIVKDAPYLTWCGLILNTHKAPLDNLLVRRAIAAGLTRKSLIPDGFINFKPAYVLLPEYLYGTNRELQPIKDDVEVAKRLLDISKKETKFLKPLNIFFRNDDSLLYLVSLRIEKVLKEMGISSRIVAADRETFDSAGTFESIDILVVSFTHTSSSELLFYRYLFRGGEDRYLDTFNMDMMEGIYSSAPRSIENILNERSIVVPLLFMTETCRIKDRIHFSGDYHLYPLGDWRKLWRE